jgi:hypothetical protein
MLTNTFVSLRDWFYPIGNTPAMNLLRDAFPYFDEDQEDGNITLAFSIFCHDGQSLLLVEISRSEHGIAVSASLAATTNPLSQVCKVKHLFCSCGLLIYHQFKISYYGPQSRRRGASSIVFIPRTLTWWFSKINPRNWWNL